MELLKVRNLKPSEFAASQVQPLESWYSRIKAALDQMVLLNQSAVEPSKEAKQGRTVLQRGCDALSMYISNVKNNPTVPRYRKISINNSSYKENLEPLAGHAQFLQAVGFRKVGSYFEWTWRPSSPEQEPSISASSLHVDADGSNLKPAEDQVDSILVECLSLLSTLRTT